MIEIAMTNGKMTLKSFAEAHGLSELAATTRLQRAVKSGIMRRERSGNRSLYHYEFTDHRIRAHDPFNLAAKKK